MNYAFLILSLFLPLSAFGDALCDKVLSHYETVHPRMEWEYNWTTAVFLYGALTYVKNSPHPEWTPQKQQELFKKFTVTAPEITMPDLASMSLPATMVDGPHAREMIALTENFFKTEPVNDIGAINHVGDRHRFFWFLPRTSFFSSSALWADSIIMYVLNGYEIARLSENEERKKFFLDQILLFDKYLKARSGLYKHAYYIDSQDTYPQTSYWARGNLWIDLGLIEILTTLSSKDPHYEPLRKMLTLHLEALRPHSTPDGLHTLIDDKESYIETSATALLAYVLKKGTRLRILDQSHEGWASEMVKATQKKVVGPSLTGISGPTTAFKYPFYYKYLVPRKADESYGVGAYLLMCSEL